MVTVKGIYNEGRIELLEPVTVSEPRWVEVTFLDTTSQDDNGSLWFLYGGESARQEALESLERVMGLLSDLTAAELAAFDEVVERRSSFLGERLVSLL